MALRRSDQQWLDDLRGDKGVDAQAEAIADLRKYQYTAIYNYINLRKNNIARLRELNNYDLSELAQDCVQKVLMKLQQNNWRRLEQYEFRCPFLLWTVPIGQREAATMFRRHAFIRPHDPIDQTEPIPSDEIEPSVRVGQIEVMDALQNCIDGLSDPRRYALTECLLKERRSKEVSLEMERTQNAVNLLVMHARRDVRTCMEEKGFSADVVELFD